MAVECFFYKNGNSTDLLEIIKQSCYILKPVIIPNNWYDTRQSVLAKTNTKWKVNPYPYIKK
jgi:hypothetical protein